MLGSVLPVLNLTRVIQTVFHTEQSRATGGSLQTMSDRDVWEMEKRACREGNKPGYMRNTLLLAYTYAALLFFIHS